MASLVNDNLTQVLSERFKQSYEMKLEPYSEQYQHLLQLRMKLMEPNNIVKNKQYFVKSSESVNSKKELAFYEYVTFLLEHDGLDLSILTPKIYYVDEKVGVTVLEDLIISGHRKCLQTSLDKNQIKAVIKAIAELHAAGYVFNRTGKKVFKSIKNLQSETLNKKRFRLKHERLETEFNALLEEFNKHDSKVESVCCHGHLIPDNILFEYDKHGNVMSCKLIGFKYARFRPPTHDLTYFLHHCTSAITKQRFYHTFLNEYYLHLKACLDRYDIDITKVLPRYDFELSCAEYAYYAKILYTVRYNQIIIDSNFDRVISEEDVHYIVQKKIKTANYSLESYLRKGVDERTGYLGEHSDLSVHIRRENGDVECLKFFVKSLPQTASQKDFAIATGGIYKELQMFRKLMSEFEECDVDVIDECVPKCYLARFNDVFVFDDLRVLNYESISARAPLDAKTLLLAVECLAKYHAAHLILEERKSEKLKREYRLIEDYHDEFKETFYTEIEQSLNFVKSMQNGFDYYFDLQDMADRKLPKDELKVMAVQFTDEFRTDVLPSRKYRNTVCHGDLWSGNIMFLKNNNRIEKCILIDFQSYRYSPPAQDLLAMIYITSDRELRAQHFQEITAHYYETLNTTMKNYNLDLSNIISQAEFESSLKHYRKFAVMQAVTHLQICPQSAERMAAFFEDPEFCQRTFFADRTEHLKACCEHDMIFKNAQLRAIADFQELCMDIKKNGF